MQVDEIAVDEIGVDKEERRNGKTIFGYTFVLPSWQSFTSNLPLNLEHPVHSEH